MLEETFQGRDRFSFIQLTFEPFRPSACDGGASVCRVDLVGRHSILVNRLFRYRLNQSEHFKACPRPAGVSARFACLLLATLVSVTSADVVTLDFTTDDNNAPLVNGQRIATPLFFGEIISISATGPNLGATVFDSTPTGPNAGGLDADMLVDQGNLLILQHQGATGMSSPDVFSTPLVSNQGGTIVFDLSVSSALVIPQSIDIVDRDATGVQLITLIDRQDRERVYFVPERYTGDVTEGGPGVATIDLTTTNSQISPFDPAVQTQINTDAGFNPNDTVRMIVRLGGSGAIDNLVLDVTDCRSDGDCDDGLFCNGVESCDGGSCFPGLDPCELAGLGVCREEDDTCVQCGDSGDCNASLECEAPARPRCNNGVCECDFGPPLCLDVVNATLFNDGGEACFGQDRIVEIDVHLGFSVVPICGAQVSLEYDSENLEFLEVIEGADIPGDDSGAAFNTLLFAFLDEQAGTLDYAIGDSPSGGCSNATSEPSVIARLRFRANEGCDSFGTCFRVASPGTRLGGSDGTKVRATSCDDPLQGVVGTCSEQLNLTIEPPSVTCPFEGRRSFDADCGTALANVSFDPVTSSDDCDDDREISCTVAWFPQCRNDGDCGPGATCGVDTPGVCDEPVQFSHACNDPELANGGGGFCAGITSISCSTTDSCEQSDVCSFEIENTGMNALEVKVQMSPVMDDGNAFDPLIRCIELDLRKCGVLGICSATGAVCDPDDPAACNAQPDNCTVPGFETFAEVELGGPSNLPGRGTARTQVPADNWDCIRVRDPWHTLQSACEVVCEDDGVLRVDLQRAPGLGTSCHWLVNGNLNGDDSVDVLDFVLLVAPNTLPDDFDKSIRCGELTPPTVDGFGDTHADINGDGSVDGLDFSFVSINFFETDEAGCSSICGSPTASSEPQNGVSEITVNALIDMGFAPQRANTADFNNDGKVDAQDMAIYANTHNP